MEKAYVEFGYPADLKITMDRELLVSKGIMTKDMLGSDDPELKQKLFDDFIAAGGDDSHSGFSWGCVESVAAVLLKHGWKSVDEIPADSPLRKRVKIATV